MAILAYGVNYRTAPLEVRERIAFPEDGLSGALRALRAEVPTLSEAVLVSTCNRTELYAVIDPSDAPLVGTWFSRHRPIAPDALARITYTYWDADAVRHLIRVAAGLDSQILGEPQIMGQIKTAYEIARSTGTLGAELNLLAQIGIAAAKRVRTDTDIGRNPVSVAYAAVSMAQRLFSDFQTKRALLIGAGEIIQRVAEHLHEHRIASMAVANRTLANAVKLAGRFAGEAMDLNAIAANLHRFDIVIASTGSAMPVVRKPEVEHAIRLRKRRPIFFVDLAVPRDVEAGVANLANVYLYTIDDLTEIIEDNIRQRRAAADAAEILVDEGTLHYMRERRAHQNQALLRQFRTSAQSIQAQELQRALRELQGGLPADQVVANLARSLTNKLIHSPTIAIRNASADGRTDLLDYVRQLYQID
jgi:glutamyl-tRNA reductase